MAWQNPVPVGMCESLAFRCRIFYSSPQCKSPLHHHFLSSACAFHLGQVAQGEKHPERGQLLQNASGQLDVTGSTSTVPVRLQDKGGDGTTQGSGQHPVLGADYVSASPPVLLLNNNFS